MTTNKLNFDGALKIATTLANNHSKYPKTPRTLSKFTSQWVDKIDISTSSSKSKIEEFKNVTLKEFEK